MSPWAPPTEAEIAPAPGDRITRLERSARAFERSGAARLVRLVGAWRGTLVINYHRIGVPDGQGFDSELWSADQPTFEDQIRLLADRFEIVSPADLIDRPDRRGRRIVITFDDGYRDNYEVALPVLTRYGVAATFFVVPGLIDRPRVAWWDEVAWLVHHSTVETLSLPEHRIEGLSLATRALRGRAVTRLTDVYKAVGGDRTQAFLEGLADAAGCGRCPPEIGADLWLTWEHVRALSAAGMTIGGHSLTHPVLSRLSGDEQAAEIDGCAARLRQAADVEMDFFSYPVGLHGTFDANTRRLLAVAGVRMAFAFEGGYLRPGNPYDRYAVPRTGVARGMSPERFAAKVTLPQLFAHW